MMMRVESDSLGIGAVMTCKISDMHGKWSYTVSGMPTINKQIKETKTKSWTKKVTAS